MEKPRGSGRLLRVLGLPFTLAVGLGTVIGGGILRTPATVLDAVPDERLALLLWVALGIHSLLEANMVAEVMTLFSRSGGYFVPAREAFGEAGGLLVGWSDWLNYVAAIAALALLAGDFAAMILPALQAHRTALSVALIVAMSLYNAAGVREGERAQIVGSALKTAFLVAIVVLVFALVPREAAVGKGAPAVAIGLGAWMVAYQTVFGAYTGWNNAGYFAGEDVDPGRNVPRGMMATIAATTILYLAVSLALFHALPFDQLRYSDLPIADALRGALGNTAVRLIAGGAILIALTCANANVMGAPRILYGLAEERLLPEIVRRVNRGGSPVVGIGLSGLAAVALAATGTFETVFLIMAALALVPQLLAELALFKLRRDRPGLPRPWRALGYPWLPVVAVVLDIALLATFLLSDWRGGLFLVLAVAIALPIGWAMRCRRARAAA